MELQYFGANCIRITTKKSTIVVDDNLGKLGLKAITKPTDISLRTSKDFPEAKEAYFKAEMPGEYEVGGFIIHGVAARAHMDKEDETNTVIYTITAGDVKAVVLGHIYPDLSEEQVEQIGPIDVAVVPIGGNGYTLDGVGALKVIKKIDPNIVIPTHYADKSIKYEVPQSDLAEGLKGLAMEPTETVARYKVKPADFGTSAHLIVLERS
ncbi:MAG: MBL fold metallo-hydrolase [Candidatus Saccharimonadales bacterium]